MVKKTSPWFVMYNDGTPTTTETFIGDGNVLQSNTLTQFSSNNGWSSALSTFNNRAYLNLTDALYVNAATGDYRARSLQSPLFGFTPSAAAISNKTHLYIEYGLDGGKRLPSNRCAGADSGLRLMTYF